jgi:hypothetical protein
MIKRILIFSILCAVILLIGIIFQFPLKESYRERYDVYSQCYSITADYEQILACIEIHKYLQGK